jgi:molybdopterin-guanine dinucleotide biosynthesis protein A
MPRPITGVILAGGLNSRFSGQPKAFLKLGGRRIIDRLVETVSGLFEEIIIVTNDPRSYLEWDATVVSDVLAPRSALTGIHTGLFYARTEHVFFAACDAPFLKQEVIQVILDAAEPDVDMVLPHTDHGAEPLCAVYGTALLETAGQAVMRGSYKIRRVFRKKRIRDVSAKRLKAVDPELVSFFNINTPHDLTAAKAMLAKMQ